MYALVGFSEPKWNPNFVFLMKGNPPHKERPTPIKKGPPKFCFATFKCKNTGGYMTKRMRGGTELLKSTACKDIKYYTGFVNQFF